MKSFLKRQSVMSKNNIEKTNVMRVLEQKGIVYKEHVYDPEKAVSGKEVAEILSQDPEKVFKTLVCVSKSKTHYVYVIPVLSELDLKKAAKAANEKNIELIPQKELLPLTGYVHGGCSPIGMKKEFKTFFDETAILFDTIMVSGGKRGYQVEVNPSDFKSIIDCEFVDLTK